MSTMLWKDLRQIESDVTRDGVYVYVNESYERKNNVSYSSEGLRQINSNDAIRKQ